MDGTAPLDTCVTVGGVPLEVVRHGSTDPDAPHLVFLHEGLGCVALWKDFPERVAAALGVGVVVYSRAGYGRSGPKPPPWPLTYMHDEGRLVLPSLLDALGLTNVVLVGHSDGASIALIHAGDETGALPRLKGVVSMAAHVFNEEISVQSIAEARTAFESGGLRDRLMRYHGDNVDNAFWGWNRAWLDPGFKTWNIEAFLPRIQVPLLVIQGEDDEYGTLRQVKAIRNQVSGPVECLILERCGHSPHRDQREPVLQALERFAARIWPDR
ncbi:alpha/beta fold hydrolase [Rhodospirillum sp. A1_3_36]|uniref:alpha/beta fold hydrolase n=1 Tax=Rhodospirillum sp. A1_3_36 TaxID=3391666 RepID=UPI0039A50A25